MTNLKHGLNHECRSLSNCETNKTVDGNVVLLVEGDYRVLDYLQGDYLQGGLSTGGLSTEGLSTGGTIYRGDYLQGLHPFTYSSVSCLSPSKPPSSNTLMWLPSRKLQVEAR